MRLKAKHTLTHIDNPEDLIYLKKEAFPVNMRLFHSNALYNGIIRDCIRAIRVAVLANYDDYKKPHGMSGANLAIPFNIIAYVENRGQQNECPIIMINPTIVYTEGSVSKKSNCGSIRLNKPINVIRHKVIHVNYFNELGDACTAIFNHDMYGGTVQHEIDHNLGILITDRTV